jgi:Asp-tRNA(Asn)/Glu-tRNA(Gln) amidotransferase C subunit
VEKIEALEQGITEEEEEQYIGQIDLVLDTFSKMSSKKS